jgi:glucans biosynthesis protein
MKGIARFLLLLASLATLRPGTILGADFDFAGLRERARLLAAKPYVAPAAALPVTWQKLTYDEYRRIQFRADQSWWRKEALPFELQFFHPGGLFNRTVPISEVVAGDATPIRFTPAFFNYDGLDAGSASPVTGFAGFRVLYDLNKPRDELGAFLGASYFRLLCEKAVYGLSARGLAINTAEPGGEEFPVFEEFWIERPTAGARQLVLYALLDSASVTGAYRFVISPGADTVVDVKAVVYCRQTVKVLGFAPLTSMFWYGENSPAAERRGPRPEVHDSDGLMILSENGEWSWRPLTNPTAARIMTFNEENPRGFGLAQRDRDFASYQDREAQYHLRPSAWVEPAGAWGRGAVRLVELPTPNEYSDNIVAFWVPGHEPSPGEPSEFDYKLHWYLDQVHPPGGWAVATQVSASPASSLARIDFAVDFDGPDLPREKTAGIEPIVSIGAGATLETAGVQRDAASGHWRATFAIKPDGSGHPVELRCFLRKPPHVLTETWTYLWNP